MAKLEDMSLEDLYARKITSSVEIAIMKKEDFSKKSDNWCNKVCKLNCKNPPSDRTLVPDQQVDVLIIQDHKAFDEPRFKRKARDIESKHGEIINQMAMTAFKAVGEFPKLTFALTSLLKCQITKPDIKKGKAPTDTILSKCRPYLLEEIRRRNPKVIISLNTSVTKALGMKKTNYGNRGEIFNSTVFTIHPRTLLMLRQNSSGKFWGPDSYKIIQRDFGKASMLARGQLRNPNLEEAVEKARKDIFIARSLEDVKQFSEKLMSEGLDENVLSYDTETNGLDPYAVDAKIITMQFGFRNVDGGITSLVFPMWHRENTFYDANEAWKFIEPILSSMDIGKIGHNIKFDILFTYCTTGCRIKNVLYDTMLLMHAKDSGTQGNLGLKQAVWDYLPEMELGGYEGLLPKIHTPKQIAKMSGGVDGEDSEDSEDSESETMENLDV